MVDRAWEKNDEGADERSGLIQFEWLKSDVKKTLNGRQVESGVNYNLYIKVISLNFILFYFVQTYNSLINCELHLMIAEVNKVTHLIFFFFINM